MCEDFCFTNTTQKTLKTSKKIFQFIRWMRKLHNQEFLLKGIDGNMRCKLLQKRSTGKTTERSKHLRHFAIEKYIFSELNRCIFQISLKYITLVFSKITLYTKIKIFDPLPPPSAKTFLKFLTCPSWKGGTCPVCRVSHRCWEHRGLFKIWWGILKSIRGGAWEGLKMLLTNTCEGVHLIVKLPAISL